jgi:RNA polymerase sigma factor (sigma-70 family)
MPNKQLENVLQHLQRLTVGQAFKKLTDGQLLERFAVLGDQAAFTALMQRHGMLVLNVCRNLLHQEQDAEDAFQAVFLVLARKAVAVAKHAKLAGWLHKTSCHCAMQVRRARARRLAHERRSNEMPRREGGDDTGWRELQGMLDEEVARLPDKYRSPFVLCCLEGKSKSEAALELGWKEGTVSGRLAQARKQLQQRLIRRGVTLSTTLCALALTQKAVAIVPTALADATAQAVFAIGGQAVGTSVYLSPQVVDVVQKVIKTMSVAKCKSNLAVFLTTAAVVLGTGALTYRGFAVPTNSPDPLNIQPMKARETSRPSTDSAMFQGDWQVIEHTVSGVQVKHENSRQFWRIAGNKVTVEYGDGNVEEMVFQVDESKKPKWIDLKTAGVDERAMVGAGVYQFNDNSLTLCLNSGKAPPRPPSFDHWDHVMNAGWRLLVFRKVDKR